MRLVREEISSRLRGKTNWKINEGNKEIQGSGVRNGYGDINGNRHRVETSGRRKKANI